MTNSQRMRQRGDDLLHHAVCEVFLLGVLAQVLERQDRDRRLVRQRQRRRSGARLPVEPDAMDPHRMVDVLQRVLAQIIERQIQLAEDLPIHVVGDEDSAGRREILQPRRHVHGAAKHVVAIDDIVADIHPDPQNDTFRVGRALVVRPHAALDGHGAAQGIDDAAELGQHAVASGVEDTAAMGGHDRIEERPLAGLEPAVGAFLVHAHHAGVADDVARKNGRQAALNVFLSHRATASTKRGAGL
jgi:hypothetical protein